MRQSRGRVASRPASGTFTPLIARCQMLCRTQLRMVARCTPVSVSSLMPFQRTFRTVRSAIVTPEQARSVSSSPERAPAVEHHALPPTRLAAQGHAVGGDDDGPGHGIDAVGQQDRAARLHAPGRRVESLDVPDPDHFARRGRQRRRLGEPRPVRHLGRRPGGRPRRGEGFEDLGVGHQDEVSCAGCSRGSASASSE